ncbi:origin recognition complex subunit 2 [Hermetia illucens]|nr:origin recognition complex subunit 2 [Hermetia illucens]XP_037913038.1 origin recognition complex subunit 2 [Hermetia illucens]
MGESGKDRHRRRSSVISNSSGFYAEYDDKKNDSEMDRIAKETDQSCGLTITPGSRKSSRKVTPNKKYDEFFELGCPKSKVNAHQVNQKTPCRASQMYEPASDEDRCHSENLFEDSTDVDGKQIYMFTTPKKRSSMTLKALRTPRTPTTLEGKDLRKHNFVGKETPKHLRSTVKAELYKRLVESSLSDFSVDESDFEPEDLSESSSTNDDVEMSDSEDNSTIPAKKVENNLLKTPLTRRPLKVDRQIEYIPQSSAYFTTHINKKLTTSDHTLNRLKNARLVQPQIFSLLSSMKLSMQHERALTNLFQQYKLCFNKWMLIMNEGYNILLYGLGSKRKLLQAFHNEILGKESVIIVNGFFPSLSMKDILEAILRDILALTPTASSNIHDSVDVIYNEFARTPEKHLFLIVHNIDGPILRSYKAQEVLSRISAIPNVHLIASMDHINTPLVWDHMNLSNFNFSCWDATTLLPYSDETSYENCLLVQNSGDLALSSMNNVFQSLTSNARKIFLLIAKEQLKVDDTNYPGLPFKDLYWLARESFLVSSDLALRAQLTEFLDHKLIKSKRTADGTEHLRIPIACNLLQQFLDNQGC